MIDNLNFRVGIVGESQLPNSLSRKLTKTCLMRSIESKNLSDREKTELIRRVATYPSNSHEYVIKNIEKLLEQIRKEIQYEERIEGVRGEVPQGEDASGGGVG